MEIMQSEHQAALAAKLVRIAEQEQTITLLQEQNKALEADLRDAKAVRVFPGPSIIIDCLVLLARGGITSVFGGRSSSFCERIPIAYGISSSSG